MDDREEFLQAVAEGDLPRVETMLRDHALASAHTPDGQSALLLALHGGHVSIARAIASRRPMLEAFELAALGDVERLTAVLERDPMAVNRRAPDGFTPLGLAVLLGQQPVVELLLRHKANPNLAAENDSRVTPLHSAAAHPQAGLAFSMVHTLLNTGADPRIRAKNGWTPLHHAASLGYRDICALLVSCGADPAAPTDTGKTPGQMAEDFGFPSIAELLGRR